MVSHRIRFARARLWFIVPWIVCIAGRPWIARGEASNAPAAEPAVAVTEDDSAFTLTNGIVTARVSKKSGDLTSLVYKDLETLASNSGHAGGYWSHDTSGGTDLKTAVTISPKTNGGERAEVSVKGISGGKKMGHGAGAAADGNFPADIEIRYCLGRGDSGIYTYCIFEHLSEYPAGSLGEARFCAKLADYFDWMTLDDRRNMAYPKELHEGDKYIYTAVQYDHPVYGWSSPAKHVGFWLINPSMEYLGGGPTKTEFLCHRDTTQVAAPCVHNYWRSSHYGGAFVEVAQGEHWTKVIGPFFLYVNSGDNPQAMWEDAKESQLWKVRSEWPYDWVAGVDYPHRDQRTTVSGHLILDDPQAKDAKLPKLMVGLTHAAYESPNANRNGKTRTIDWQIDAKDYEFWIEGNLSGFFYFQNVRPGNYTLHAFADGVLGEFAKADVNVEAGQPLRLGDLKWQPVRHGKQLWDMGIPNRNGSEFFMADEVNDPEISLKYPKLFPNDVNYEIGKSDFRKDWFFQHVPHCDDPNAKAVPYFGIRGSGRATPYSIHFDLPADAHGTATLRLAICATGASEIDVTVNDKPVGKVDHLIGDGAITRHSIQGIWYERELAFDAAAMKQGANVLQLIVPAGSVNNGVIYDYIRLELDDAKEFQKVTAAAPAEGVIR